MPSGSIPSGTVPNENMMKRWVKNSWVLSLEIATWRMSVDRGGTAALAVRCRYVCALSHHVRRVAGPRGNPAAFLEELG